MVKVGRAVPEIYAFWDRQTNRQTDTLITILHSPMGSRVKVFFLDRVAGRYSPLCAVTGTGGGSSSKTPPIDVETSLVGDQLFVRLVRRQLLSDQSLDDPTEDRLFDGGHNYPRRVVLWQVYTHSGKS